MSQFDLFASPCAVVSEEPLTQADIDEAEALGARRAAVRSQQRILATLPLNGPEYIAALRELHRTMRAIP